MSSEIKAVLEFLDEQKKRHPPRFPVYYDAPVSFLTTTSRPRSFADVSIHPVVRLEPGGAERELEAHLRGSLPRPPGPGECITVSISRLEQFKGYQVKTRAAAPPDPPAALFSESQGELLVKGSQTFTVHTSPYTMKFFEQIPYDEVQHIIADVRFAPVAVGEQANISPRDIFHHELKQNRLTLFHGDGLAFKTFMNLKVNRHVTQIVVDLDTFEGWAMRGVLEEFSPHQHPEAYDKICQGFSVGNWGQPSRLFRFVAEHWFPIAPAAG